MTSPRFGKGRIGPGGRREAAHIACQRGVQPGDIHLCVHQVARDLIPIGRVGRGIELDQHVTGADMVSIGDHDPFYDTDFQRLDQLDLAGRDDPPIGAGDNIELAETCPDNRHRHEHDEDTHHESAGGRNRRLDDLQGSGQKLTLVPALARRQSQRERDELAFHRARFSSGASSHVGSPRLETIQLGIAAAPTH